ncbi:MAG: YihY/virulence factor BrkB family protein [Nitrospiraceae bacterium]
MGHAVSYNPWRLGDLSIIELGRRLWKESQSDDILGRAAQLAYYFVLALFPALLFLTALVGFLPLERIMPRLMNYLGNLLPSDALSLVEKYLQQVVRGSGKDILSLGLVGALWASSSGVTAVMDSLNAVYNAAETRPYWKVRLIAVAMTVGLAGFIIASTTLVLYGEHIGAWVANLIGFGWLFTMGWVLVQWPLAVALMLFAVGVLYYFAPNIDQDWQWVTPGSLFAVVMWLIVSLGFKLYVENFGNYNAAYGSIAGVIVLMLWFYLSGIVLLSGGEINSEIAKAAGISAKRSESVRWTGPRQAVGA